GLRRGAPRLLAGPLPVGPDPCGASGFKFGFGLGNARRALTEKRGTEMVSRREFMRGSVATGGALLASRSTYIEAQSQAGGAAAGVVGPIGAGSTRVITANGVSLSYRVMEGVKGYHLIAEPVEHEFAPGLNGACWGYNGRTPGPTIEAVE